LIRIHYSTDLPLLAEVGSNGRHIGIIVNPDLHGLLTVADKQRLFNELMAEFDRMPGVTTRERTVQASAVVIDIQSVIDRRRSAVATGCREQKGST
jgi:hypothetical protein